MVQSGMFIRINYSEKEESLTFMQFHPQESLVIRVNENDLTLSRFCDVLGDYSKVEIHYPVGFQLNFEILYLFQSRFPTTE